MLGKLLETTNGKDMVSKIWEMSGFPADNALMISVYYDMGGVSWATGDRKPRGYYLSVTPVSWSPTVRSVRGFSGTYMLLRHAGRFSSKTLQALAQEYLKDTDPLQGDVGHVMADVVAKAIRQADGGKDEEKLDEWRQWVFEWVANNIINDEKDG